MASEACDQQSAARLIEIQKQISQLATEGVALANQLGVNFSLADAPFATAYGAGHLEYYHEGSEEDDGYGDTYAGQWRSSGSDFC